MPGRSGSTDTDREDAGFACTLPVRADWPVRLLRLSPALVGVAGVLIAAWQSVVITGMLSGTAFGLGVVGVGALACLLVVVKLAGQAGSAGPRHPSAALHGWLLIANDGGMAWQGPGQAQRRPVVLRRWYAGPRVAWLRLADGVASGNAPVREVLLVRRAADEAAWCRLRAWLVWRERGGGRN